MPSCRFSGLLLRRAVLYRWSRLAFRLTSGSFRFNAPAQRIHKIDDLGGLALAWRFDLYAFLLFLEQLFHRTFVLVLKFLRIEIACFGISARHSNPCRA
jgi:hypothetical protein